MTITSIIQHFKVVFTNVFIFSISLRGLQLFGIAKQNTNSLLNAISSICSNENSYCLERNQNSPLIRELL